MVKRRQRDIYGNWVWTDDELDSMGEKKGENSPAKEGKNVGNEEQTNLDWRDYVALTIASLETFLLPIVVFIIILIILVLILALFK